MEDSLAILMSEYDDLLLKQGKSEDDIERIECIEVSIIEQFGPCAGTSYLRGES